MLNKNIHEYQFIVNRQERERILEQRAKCIFFTGLSGSGKSTISNGLEKILHVGGLKTYTLDGDNIRKGINNNLGFSPEDRTENLRRIYEEANPKKITLFCCFLMEKSFDQKFTKRAYMTNIFPYLPVESCNTFLKDLA